MKIYFQKYNVFFFFFFFFFFLSKTHFLSLSLSIDLCWCLAYLIYTNLFQTFHNISVFVNVGLLLSFFLNLFDPSQLGLKNTPTASLQRGVRPSPQRVSWIRYKTNWWDSSIRAFGNAEWPFIAPLSTLTRSGNTW